MIKPTLAVIVLSIGSIAFANTEVNGCAAHLIEKLEYHAGRAEKLCSSARKVGNATPQFSTCLIDIHTETKLALEIIAPYCMRRSDLSYKDCVITTFKSNSNDNAFKSCLKKSSNIAKLHRHDIKGSGPTAPSKVKISVGYVKGTYSLED